MLITPTARRRFQDGKNLNTHGEYPDAVKAIAARENLPLIDLTAMSTTLFETYGEEQSKKFLVHYPANTFPNQPKPLADNTHFNTFGAYEICRCVLQGMKRTEFATCGIFASGLHEFQSFATRRLEQMAMAGRRCGDCKT